MKRHAALLCSWLLTSLPALAAGPPSVAASAARAGIATGTETEIAPEIATEVATEEPRAFGYQVGDQFSRQVFVRVPATWQLDPASVPATRRGQPIELRRVQLHSKTVGGTVRHRIELHYQVFYSPPAVRVLELAPWWLKFNNGTRQEELRVEAWPISVAPLLPTAVNNRRGLGDMQPDAPPPLINTQAQQRRLGLYAALALLLATGLAVLHWGPPWRAARNRPFGRAWRELRALPTQPNPKQWQAALRCVHQALNRSAGGVVFRHNLPNFIQQQPRFAPLHNELTRFLAHSEQVFFGDQAAPQLAPDVPWLTQLARRLHDAERGLA
jgi:mxaA protein